MGAGGLSGDLECPHSFLLSQKVGLEGALSCPSSPGSWFLGSGLGGAVLLPGEQVPGERTCDSQAALFSKTPGALCDDIVRARGRVLSSGHV